MELEAFEVFSGQRPIPSVSIYVGFINFVMRTTISAAVILALSFQIVAVSADRAVTTSEGAVSNLQDLWRDSLGSKSQERKDFAHINGQIADSKNIRAEQITCGAAQKRSSLLSSLAPDTRQKLIVYGSLEALKQRSSIWAVYNPGTNDAGFEAYLDASTGKLLLLWIIPEG
ncbi:MAG: hypothetical protein ACJ8R9_32525 [Steroidobacteraceae bacterium]